MQKRGKNLIKAYKNSFKTNNFIGKSHFIVKFRNKKTFKCVIKKYTKIKRINNYV